DEEDIHAAKFLDPAVFGGIEEDHLIAAVSDRFSLSQESGGVVAATLDRSCTAWGGAAEVRGDPDGDGLGPAFEIRPHGAGDDTEGIFGRRPHPEESLA